MVWVVNFEVGVEVTLAVFVVHKPRLVRVVVLEEALNLVRVVVLMVI